jgi:surfactin family lipopeptide synthetase A
MAEATLMVTCSAPFSNRRVAWIDREAFRKEGRVVLAGAEAKNSMPLLSNGPEVGEAHVRIADADGNDQPEGQQGRVLISGVCVTREYFNSDEDPQPDGWLDSGDLGFLLHGELYISGRSKDVIIRGGHNVHAHEIEEFILREFSENCLRAVAFAIPREDDLRDELILGLEFRRLPAPDNFDLEVTKFVSRELGIQIDQVIPLPKGAIPRTTSGKLQRARARELYRTGELLPTSEGRENG